MPAWCMPRCAPTPRLRGCHCCCTAIRSAASWPGTSPPNDRPTAPSSEDPEPPPRTRPATCPPRSAGALAGLDEPPLFVVGADDRHTPARAARAVLVIAPLAEGSARRLVVPGRGHEGATATDASREAVAAFVEHVVGAAPPTG